MKVFFSPFTSTIKYIKQMFCTSIKPNIKRETSKFISKNNTLTLIQSETLLNKILQERKNIEDDLWVKIRADLINSLNIEETNLDIKIFNLCFYYKQYDIAKKYFKFLESNKYEIKFNVYGQYIKTFFLQNVPITEEEESEILRVYKNLRQKYPLLDKSTCSDCISTLSLTKNWKETLLLLQMIEISNKCAGNNEIALVIIACLNNNEDKLAWKLMNEAILKSNLRQDIYIKYLDYCKRNFYDYKFITELEKIFLFWKKHNIYPTDQVINVYSDFYKAHGYSLANTTITDKGICHNCSLQLEKTTLTQDEFKLLSQSFMKNAIIGKNIFYASSPQELKRYMIFINSMKPYNLVIDGLNVAYALRTKSTPGSLKPILDIVETFHKKGQRILVIGRVHMLWWSNKLMKEIQQKADTFFIKNLSEDDPFLLHVSLISGPQTYFVSRDLMRGHKFKLVDPKLKNLFKTWQMSRQYIYKINRSNKTVELIEPIGFEVNIQKSEKGWHIPFTSDTKIFHPDLYSLPKQWVCLRSKK